MEWNTNVLEEKINVLKFFLKSENIEICLVSATQFTNQKYMGYNPNHPSK